MTEMHGMTIEFGTFKSHRFVFKFDSWTELGSLTIYDICLEDFDPTQEYSFRGEVFDTSGHKDSQLSAIVEIPRLEVVDTSHNSFMGKDSKSLVQLKMLKPLNPLAESAFTITFEQV